MRRVVVSRVCAVALVVPVLGAVLGSSENAWAAKGVVSVFGASGSGDGQFANAYGTAVNTSSGDVYVVDQGNNRVERFDAGGGFVGAFGWGVADGSASAQTCASSCQPGIAGSGDGQFDGPQGIAVDQSDGSLYVVDGNNGRVEKFDSSGAYLSQFGSAGSGDGQFSGPQGVAVDPTDGSVYVADTNNHRVEKFDSAGLFQSQFGSEGSGDGQFEGPTRVAVDSTGQVYVLDAGNLRIERFTAAGVFDEVFDPTDVFVPQEIAIGPGNDHLYVAQWAQDFSEQQVIEIDASGTLQATHGVGSSATNASGLALSSGSQKIYLADGFNARVFVLDDITVPSVSIDPATSVTSTSASISGTLNPNGPPNVGWHFETSTDEASWTPVAADQDAGSGTSDIPLSANLSGLVPNTTYFVRLVATRPFNAPAASTDVQFTTGAIAPDVSTQPAQDITPSHAVLEATLNAHHSPTTFFFEYGTTTAYGTSVPATHDADGGASPVTVGELQPVEALQPGTTYHYRIVASNQVGTTHGQDQTFTTTTPPPPSTPRAGIPGAGVLPDARGWEQVSPTIKHGADVMANSQRTRAASSETPNEPMAATFSSLAGFGDVQGTGVANDYMSIRTAQPNSQGWTTHAITPHQDSMTFLAVIQGLEPKWEGEFSADLSRGMFRAWSPLTSAPNVKDVVNDYVRDDLRTAGGGSYQLLTDCPACSSPLPAIFRPSQAPYPTGASSDFSHVIFESPYQLTTDAPPTPPSCVDLNDGSGCTSNLYEWVNGTLRLAGILPDGTAAPVSISGQGAGHYTRHTISSDGSRIFFTDPTTGMLYMRLNGTSTVQLNASEKTVPDATQPAQYEDASADGSRVFFTTGEQLTNDPAPGGNNLYMYDANAAAGHHLTLLSVDHNSEDAPNSVVGVIGASTDGHYVYFIAGGQLVAGEPVLNADRGIYEWHDGTIAYIGQLANPGFDTDDDVPGSWALRPATSRVAPDGRHMLFLSSSGVGLTGYEQNGHKGLYLYSADSHRLQCVSCNPNGAPATADATVVIRTGTGASGTSSHLTHPLADDGSRVFFSTAEALVPGDLNGKIDTYEFDATTGTVHLLSGGTDPSDSYFMDASASGSDVFLLTRQHLTGWDDDQNYDLYDARVNGGLPDPQPAVRECSGETCQGQPPGGPAIAATGSVTAVGGGNVKAIPKAKPKPVRCRHGFVRKRVRGRVRCVKAPKRHVKRARARTKVR